MKKIIILTTVVILIIIVMSFVFDWGRSDNPTTDLNNNITASGTIQDYSSTTTVNSDMPIIVNNIKDNQEVSNPIKIEGKAVGNWFFEATFPIQLVDINGNILASTVARAQTDWATTSFVNFTATLNYKKSTSTSALIVLSKDNPSDNLEFDQSIFIPVILK